MTSNDQVIVVGGGPAGLAAAIVLRSRKIPVLVVDAARPPIEKVCGEGLLPETLESLDKIGVNVGALPGAPFYGVRYIKGQTAVEARLPGRFALGIRRVELHRSLLAAAEEAGVQFSWETPVEGLGKRSIRVPGRHIPARWIVGADGMASRVRRWGGLEPALSSSQRFAFRQHFRAAPWTDFLEVHWNAVAQAYVTVTGPDEICVVTMSRNPYFRLGQALEGFPELKARLKNAVALDQERGAVSRNRILHRVTRDNVALVGDASGSVDAITGEGLGLAFRQAHALADAIAAGDLRRYQTAHRRLRRKSQWMSRLLLTIERSERLQDQAFAALAGRPRLFERLLRTHVGGGSPIEVAKTGFQLGWSLLSV